jgi:hypothetical protein
MKLFRWKINKGYKRAGLFKDSNLLYPTNNFTNKTRRQCNADLFFLLPDIKLQP